MKTRPSRLKPSRLRRMNELSTVEKETRQIYEEFEEYRRIRMRLARRTRKLANNVRRRYPDMCVASDADLTLHSMVDNLADELQLPDGPKDRELSDDNVHSSDRAFDDLFHLLKMLSDVPWLKGA